MDSSDEIDRLTPTDNSTINTVSLDATPLNRAAVPHNTTNCATFMHLIKGNVGTGMLALPGAFLSAGLWVGFVGILFVGTCCIYCMHLLISSCHKLCTKTESLMLEYGDVMEKALEMGPVKMRRASKFGRAAVNLSLLLTQFGFCSVYFVFVSANIKRVIHHTFTNDPDLRVYMAVLFVIFIPYILIKHLKIIAFFSGLGNILAVISTVIIIVCLVSDLPDVSSRPAFNSTQTLPLFLGTVFYTFEGIGTLLPIENMMATPEDLGGWTGVLNLAMVIATCMYTAMGFYGYLKFGDSIKGSITLNLPSTALYQSVNVMFAVVMFITFALQFYVPINILWPWCRNKIGPTRHSNKLEVVFRISVLALTGCMAIVVPHLDLLIALVGALASSSLAVIFPPFIDMLVRSADGTLSPRIIIIDSLLCLLGIVAFVSGTFVSLRAIIKTF